MQDPPTERIVNENQIREQMREAIQNTRVVQDDAGRVTVTTQAPTGIATTQPPPEWATAFEIPERTAEVAIASMVMLAAIIIGYPLARAMARAIDRMYMGGKKPQVEITSQLAQLNQAVEAIAVEVERISEGQRFTTKLLAEQHKLPTASRNVS